MIFSTPVKLKFEQQIREWTINDILSSKAATNLIIKTQHRAQHQFPRELLDTINSELNSYGMPGVSYADSYLRRKGSKQYLHVDGHEHQIFCAINIPLMGTTNSGFQYYGGDYEIVEKTAKGLRWLEPVWNGEPQLLEDLELTTPHLVRVDVPHMAVANAAEDRWILSIRFLGNPSYEYMQDCIARNNL
jgi:hypothetical protein